MPNNKKNQLAALQELLPRALASLLTEEKKEIFRSTLLKIIEDDENFLTYLLQLLLAGVTFATKEIPVSVRYIVSSRQIIVANSILTTLQNKTYAWLKDAVVYLLLRHGSVNALDAIPFHMNKNSLYSEDAPEKYTGIRKAFADFNTVTNSLFNAIACIATTHKVNSTALDKLALVRLPPIHTQIRVDLYNAALSHGLPYTYPFVDQIAHVGSYCANKNDQLPNLLKYIIGCYPLGQNIFMQETFNPLEVVKAFEKTAVVRGKSNISHKYIDVFQRSINTIWFEIFDRLTPDQQQTLDTLLLVYSNILERLPNPTDPRCINHELFSCVVANRKDCIVSLAQCLYYKDGFIKNDYTKFALDLHAYAMERSNTEILKLTPQLVESLCPSSTEIALAQRPLVPQLSIQPTPKRIGNNTHSSQELQSFNDGRYRLRINSPAKHEPINLTQRKTSPHYTNTQKPQEETQPTKINDNGPTLWNTAYQSFLTSFCDSLAGELLQKTNLSWWQQKIIQHTLSTGLFLLLGSSLTSLLLPKAILFLLEQVMKYIGINNVKLYGYKIDVLNSVLIASQFTSLSNIPGVLVSFASSTFGMFAAQKSTAIIVNNHISSEKRRQNQQQITTTPMGVT